jgi:hypothetical protein
MQLKGVMLIMLIVAIVPLVEAYKTARIYNTTIVYDDSLDYKVCKMWLKGVPEAYWSGLRYMKVMNKHFAVMGGFYMCQSHMILLVQGCQPEVIIHEFAHYWQEQDGDSCGILVAHRGNFDYELQRLAEAYDVGGQY